MLDLVAALEWTKKNVAAFGGDPRNITINGESAGSLAVSALMASPLSKHLVHKAIGQSGAYFPSPSPGLAEKPLADKEQDGVKFAASMSATSLAELRAKPAEEVLATVMKTGGWGYAPAWTATSSPSPSPPPTRTAGRPASPSSRGGRRRRWGWRWP